MPDDELKESSERNLLDSLDIGKVALTVGAGTALFYRSGGAKYLSDGEKKASKFTTHAHSEVSVRSLTNRKAGGIKDILEASSPLLKQALKRPRGEKREDMEINLTNFTNRNLPGVTWAGLRPSVDMADVQVKTINNEGMLLSDIGFYESQFRDPDIINASNLEPKGEQDITALQANMKATLKGLGLWGVDISVQPALISGIQVVANITKRVEYKIDSVVNDIFKLL
jgi:hypothetical protein